MTDRESRGHHRPRTTRGTLGAMLWIAAGAIYLVAEAVAAAAFRGYSYANNYISDLGVPDVGIFQGRTLDSPLHTVMNTGFVLQGTLFLAAMILVIPVLAARRNTKGALVVLASLHALGIVLVGCVHGSEQTVQSGLAAFHFVGAALAIVCGNLAAIAAGIASRDTGLPRPFRICSILIGVVGLLSLTLLQTHDAIGLSAIPDGVWERLAVYTIVVWEVTAGIVLVTGRARD
jgi:hypothetical membrane protein